MLDRVRTKGIRISGEKLEKAKVIVKCYIMRNMSLLMRNTNCFGVKERKDRNGLDCVNKEAQRASILHFLLLNKSAIRSTVTIYLATTVIITAFIMTMLLVFCALCVQPVTCELHHKHYSNLRAEPRLA